MHDIKCATVQFEYSSLCLCSFIIIWRIDADVYDVSVLYDQVRKGAPPSPQQVELNSAPYKIQPKGPDPDHIGMEFETCVAYGL